MGIHAVTTLMNLELMTKVLLISVKAANMHSRRPLPLRDLFLLLLMPHMNHSSFTTMVCMLILPVLLRTLIMVFWQLDMALLRMVMTTGLSKTHGEPHGEMRVMSKSHATKTTCVEFHPLLHSHLFRFSNEKHFKY